MCISPPAASSTACSQSITRTSPQRSACPRPDGPQAQIQGRPGDLCPAQSDGGARSRSDQGLEAPGSVPIAGLGEGEWGMGADGHHPQPALAAGFSEGVAVLSIVRDGTKRRGPIGPMIEAPESQVFSHYIQVPHQTGDRLLENSCVSFIESVSPSRKKVITVELLSIHVCITSCNASKLPKPLRTLPCSHPRLPRPLRILQLPAESCSNESGSNGCAKEPVLRSSTMSSKTPVLKATTGVPQACASETVWPKVSWREGTTIAQQRSRGIG